MQDEDILFEKEAFMNFVRAAYRLGKGIGYLPGKAIQGAGQAASKVLPHLVPPVRAVMSAPVDLANKALTVAGRATATGVAGGAATAAGIGKGIATGVGKGVIAPAAKGLANSFKKRPVGTSLGLLSAYGGMQDAMPLLTGQTYASHLQGMNANSGRAFMQPKYDWASKLGEEAMPKLSMRDLEMDAELPYELTKEAGKMGFKVTGDDLKQLLMFTALPAAVGMIAAPAFEGLGKKLKNKLMGDDSHEEYANTRAKTLGEHDALEQIADRERKLKERVTRPAMMDIFENLKKHDSVIGAAAKDKQTSAVLHNTLDTVYNFAPNVATNHSALKAVLREAAVSPDGGLSFQTIKQIADAQKLIRSGEGH